jgi:hypothetical protein
MRGAERERARVWVLNLEAEHELETRGPFVPSARLAAIVRRERRRLIGSLVARGDRVLDEGEDSREAMIGSCAGLEGVAWCPTPRALARLTAAGAATLAAPPVAVLRRVNARPFTVGVRELWTGASFEKRVAADLDGVLKELARPAADGWLVRRTFGAAGRGRRRIAAGRPDEPARRWIEAGLRRGPLVIEPWVEVTREYTRSAWVAPDGRISISRACFQETSAEGAWCRTVCAERGAVSRADDALLAAVVEAAGRALAAAGYFGPFGIDAFRHRTARGEALNPLSEINARFTMDWATAMASARRGDGPGAVGGLLERVFAPLGAPDQAARAAVADMRAVASSAATR